MQRVMTNLPDELGTVLRAKADGRPLSAVIRRAPAYYLEDVEPVGGRRLEEDWSGVWAVRDSGVVERVRVDDGPGAVAIGALEEQFTASLHRAPESIVFCHPALGTPLDPSKLTKYARKALDRAASTRRYGRGTGSVTRRPPTRPRRVCRGCWCRRRQPRAGLDDRALPARREDELPGRPQLAGTRLFGAVASSDSG
jgi:hypothetical protein